jgi:hypothetical protein
MVEYFECYLRTPSACDIEASAVSIGQHPVEFWPFLFGARDADVDVFIHDGPAAARTVFLHFASLDARVLALAQGYAGLPERQDAERRQEHHS